MADKKIIPSWGEWLYSHFVAKPMTFLFVTHRKTTMCALIVGVTIFSLAICFPPFLPALIAFKLISFAPFAFMGAMGMTHAALTAAGLGASATVLAVKSLYLAEQAIRATFSRFHHYFYPTAAPTCKPELPVMETYTVQALFSKFKKAAQAEDVVKVKKNGTGGHIDITRLVLTPSDGASQDILQVPKASTAIDWLAAINLVGYSIFKESKAGSLSAGHALCTDKLWVNAP